MNMYVVTGVPIDTEDLDFVLDNSDEGVHAVVIRDMLRGAVDHAVGSATVQRRLAVLIGVRDAMQRHPPPRHAGENIDHPPAKYSARLASAIRSAEECLHAPQVRAQPPSLPISSKSGPSIASCRCKYAWLGDSASIISHAYLIAADTPTPQFSFVCAMSVDENRKIMMFSTIFNGLQHVRPDFAKPLSHHFISRQVAVHSRVVTQYLSLALTLHIRVNFKVRLPKPTTESLIDMLQITRNDTGWRIKLGHRTLLDVCASSDPIATTADRHALSKLMPTRYQYPYWYGYASIWNHVIQLCSTMVLKRTPMPYNASNSCCKYVCEGGF